MMVGGERKGNAMGKGIKEGAGKKKNKKKNKKKKKIEKKKGGEVPEKGEKHKFARGALCWSCTVWGQQKKKVSG